MRLLLPAGDEGSTTRWNPVECPQLAEVSSITYCNDDGKTFYLFDGETRKRTVEDPRGQARRRCTRRGSRRSRDRAMDPAAGAPAGRAAAADRLGKRKGVGSRGRARDLGETRERLREAKGYFCFLFCFSDLWIQGYISLYEKTDN